MEAIPYVPGCVVPVSGQYAVVNYLGWLVGRDVTCVAGHRFPPLPLGYRFVLTDPTVHWR